jgi:hypothetical protein
VPKEIPDLWGDEIRLDVRTPLMILNAQADMLSRKTKGVIKADISEKKYRESWTVIHFDLLAPSAHSVRTRILAIMHANLEAYPVTVAGTALAEETIFERLKPGSNSTIPNEAVSIQRIIYTEDEFLKAVRVILRSGFVLSKIQSLIAKSNEAAANRGESELAPSNASTPALQDEDRQG